MPSIKDIKDGKKDVVITVIVISLIIFIFLWRFVFSELEYEYVPEPTLKTAPEIDFNYLSGPEFDYFDKYEQIESLDEDLMGRDNPFLPYSGQIIRRQPDPEPEPEEDESQEEDEDEKEEEEDDE